jgi:signal transduction histidine kinase
VADVHRLHPGPHRSSLRLRFTKSVRWRLTLTVIVVVGLALLGGTLLLAQWVEATLVTDLRSRNEEVLARMEDALGQGRLPAELLMSQTDLERQLEATGTTDVDLEELLSSTFFYVDGPALSGRGVRGLVDDQGRLVLFGRSGLPAEPGTDYTEVRRVVQTQFGPLTLHAVAPLDSVHRSVRAFTGALSVGLPLLVAAAGVMTWVIAGRTLAPVATMTRRVRELSATNLDARVPVPPSGDEIAELAVTMNEMLDRLQRASVAQRQFVSDASHELRSPVASIRAQLETALRYPDDVDWPEVARVVLAEDDRLDHLVGNLLALARLEEGRRGPRTEVDLEDLVLAQLRRLTGVSCDASAVSAGRVWGNASELTSVVRNLVDNAARHARSTVAVSVRDEGPWVVVRVEDDGAGVPPEDRDRIFERFARLEEGRSRDGGGAGLGLALSRRIVEQHGGRIHVEDRDGGGAAFVVTFPSASWTGTEAAGSAVESPDSPGAATMPARPDGVPRHEADPGSGSGDRQAVGELDEEPSEGARRQGRGDQEALRRVASSFGE